MLVAVLIGVLLGFIGSMPVAGPISALVFSRGVEGRFRSGVFIALGGGIGEASYAFLAFWGFSTYLDQYPFIVPASRAAAAVFLVILGVTFVRYRTIAQTDRKARETGLASFALGFTLCALNPTLIATWTAAVTTLYSIEVLDFSSGQALPFALGACVGIAGWFCALLVLIRNYRDRFTEATLVRVVRVVGWCLLALAVWFAARFVQYLVAG